MSIKLNHPNLNTPKVVTDKNVEIVVNGQAIHYVNVTIHVDLALSPAMSEGFSAAQMLYLKKFLREVKTLEAMFELKNHVYIPSLESYAYKTDNLRPGYKELAELYEAKRKELENV